MTRADLIAALATSHPSISRGRVWCKQCRRSRAVDAAQCLAHGWPECCGQTMTIDAPTERAALKTALPIFTERPLTDEDRAAIASDPFAALKARE